MIEMILGLCGSSLDIFPHSGSFVGWNLASNLEEGRVSSPGKFRGRDGVSG